MPSHIVKYFIQLVLFGVLSMPAFAGADILPPPSDYVVDQAGIITQTDREMIKNWARELEQKTSAQVAVLTVPSIGDESIENYAVNVFKQWGIGQKQKDNGILLVIAAQDRRLRIEVGYGLEGAVTDVQSHRIIEAIIVPEFKTGNFSQGVLKGTWAIVSLVAKEYNVKLSGSLKLYHPSKTPPVGSWF